MQPTTSTHSYKTVLFWLSRIPLTIVLALFLFWLGQIDWIMPYTGDGHYTEELAEKDWVVLMHSSLTTIMHKTVYTILKPWGWSAWNAISLSSSLAGAIALQVLFSLSRHPLFLIINILSGSFLVFVGEVESYAWVNLFLLLSFLATERYLTGRWPLWPAAAFIFIAALFHMLALFYLPGLFWVMRRNPKLKPWEFLVPFVGFITLSIAIILIFPREGPDLDMGRLTPLFNINRKGQLFTFFSLSHWELLSYFHWKGSFLQLFPIEIPLLILLRTRINTAFRQYLLICSIMGLLWTTVWHPDLGRLDWDLFSQMFIPIHVLLGFLATDFIHERYITLKKA